MQIVPIGCSVNVAKGKRVPFLTKVLIFIIYLFIYFVLCWYSSGITAKEYARNTLYILKDGSNLKKKTLFLGVVAPLLYQPMACAAHKFQFLRLNSLDTNGKSLSLVPVFRGTPIV